MGTRGPNRRGYYLALLFTLELHYERERRLKGDDPAAWLPAPRNRPDHFCEWTLDAVSTLNAALPRTFAELLSALDALRLPHIAQVLEVAIRRQTGLRSAVADELELEALLALVGDGGRPSERHPQARKFAQAVSASLDRSWRRALNATAREFASMEGLPSMALLLGGLPPSFHTLDAHIFGRLRDHELVREHGTLTVVQFYGLVGGALPPPPPSWQALIDTLAACERGELERLAGLSSGQRLKLRSLGAAAADDDPELARWLQRGEISRRLLRELQRMSDASWISLDDLFRSGQHAWALAYLDDRSTLERLYRERTSALLDLRELFPLAFRWLDAYLSHHLEDALRQDVTDLAPRATTISRRVRQLLWLPDGAPE